MSISKHVEACYGIPATDGKDRYLTCHACGAMGVDVEVNVPSKIGGTGKKMGKKCEKIRQIGRPRECVLCSHDKGTHGKVICVYGYVFIMVIHIPHPYVWLSYAPTS